VAWTFILSIHKGGWDALKIDNNNISFYQKVSVKFSNLPTLPVSPKLSKEELTKSCYYKKNYKKSQNQFGRKKEHTYAQALSRNVKEILKLKNNFPNISSKKIKEIYRTINNTSKMKSHINMTTKDASYK